MTSEFETLILKRQMKHCRGLRRNLGGVSYSSSHLVWEGPT